MKANFAAVPSVKLTVPPETETGVAIDSVFVSIVVEERVQVETPDPSDIEQAPYTLVDPVLVAVKVGVYPERRFEEASLIVIVTVEFEYPSAETGPVPVIVEVTADGAPPTTIAVEHPEASPAAEAFK